MKLIIISCILFLTSVAHGQNYILPEGEFMDTTTNKDLKCIANNHYYYSFDCKYPEASRTLLNNAQAFLRDKNEAYEGSGYITFRFKIDCDGKRMKKVQVFQTDEKYHVYHFNKNFVNELYVFMCHLDKWKIAKSEKGSNYSYNTFLTYKIKNGKVINIIP